MSNFIRFGFTALNGTNKVGTITPDEDGYYEMVLGGLNIFNSANQYYPYEPAKDLFTSSGQLMRRVGNGALRGEYGHPKQAPGQSIDSFAQRILSIYEECVSHHIKEVTLDFDRYKDPQGRKVIAIIGKIKPTGPYGDTLKGALENKNENVSFSWDYVSEPGISIANKFQSPALEEISETMFTKKHFERALALPAHGVAQESIRLDTAELFSSLGWDREGSNAVPAYLKW
jgi:hypothetical protein